MCVLFEQAMKAAGSIVYVTEVDPICALQVRSLISRRFFPSQTCVRLARRSD